MPAKISPLLTRITDAANITHHLHHKGFRRNHTKQKQDCQTNNEEGEPQHNCHYFQEELYSKICYQDQLSRSVIKIDNRFVVNSLIQCYSLLLGHSVVALGSFSGFGWKESILLLIQIKSN